MSFYSKEIRLSQRSKAGFGRREEHAKTNSLKRGESTTQGPPPLCSLCKLKTMAARHRAAPLSILGCLLQEFEQPLLQETLFRGPVFITWICRPGGQCTSRTRGDILSMHQGALLGNKLSHATWYFCIIWVYERQTPLFFSVPPSAVLDPKSYRLLNLACSFKLGNEKNHPLP